MSLKTDEKVFKNFFENTVEAILFCNPDGKIVEWNKGSEFLFGYNSEEIQAYSIFSLIDRTNFDSFSFLFESAKKGRSFCFETRCVNKTGDILDMEVTIGLLQEQDRELIHCIFRDISHIKKLRREIKNIEMFSDSNPDLLLVWDKLEGITYYNAAVKQLFMDSDKEVDPVAILPGDIQNQLKRLTVVEKTIQGLEVNFEGRTISYCLTPFRENLNKVLIVGKDITDNRQLVSQVETSFEQTQELLDLVENVLKELSFSITDEKIDFNHAVNLILRDEEDITATTGPAYLFIGLENVERSLEGYLFYKRQGIVQSNSTPIFFNSVDFKRVVSRPNEKIFINSKDNDNLKEKFPENFGEIIPEVNNFSAFHAKNENSCFLVALNYKKRVGEFEAEALKGIANAICMIMAIQTQVQYAEESQFITMYRIAEMAEKRDHETSNHLNRIKNYSRLIAEELAKMDKYKHIINRDFIKRLYHSAALHDIGKVGIPENILQKPGKLDTNEFELMREHTLHGGKMLGGPKFLEMAQDIAYYHHEKYDGTGYPYGSTGEEIPLAARIVAIADVYDAMTSKRSYKEAFSHDRTKKLITICSGGHFDPDVVDAFVAREQDFIRVKEMYKD